MFTLLPDAIPDVKPRLNILPYAVSSLLLLCVCKIRIARNDPEDSRAKFVAKLDNLIDMGISEAVN